MAWEQRKMADAAGDGGQRHVASPSDPTSNATSLIEVLQARAGATPDGLAFCYLIDGEEEGPRLTYAGLDRAARSIAAVLRDGAGPGDRALLVYEPGLEFIPAFFGCLYAGLVSVPAYPPRLDRLAQSWQVLAGVAADCQPRAVLTTGGLAAALARGFNHLSQSGDLRCLATDSIDLSHAGRWHEPRIDPDATALLQYTSGSTAAPKGVEVTHRNLMHNERMLQTAMDHFGTGSGVCWLPLYHDMGLVGGVLQAVFQGSPAYLMSPLGLLQKPFRWLQAISRYRADTSGGPNFAYDLCVQRVTPEQKATLDLSNWTAAGIGSEPVSARTIERFTEAFAPCGFKPEASYPCYGLAEATLFVTGGWRWDRPVIRRFCTDALEHGRVVEAAPGTADARTLVGCGRPWLDQQVVIVDPESRVRRPEEIVGEIWVAGPSVARGYWNRLDETEYTFRARLHDTGEGPFLRTGDLGFIRDGELFVTGRLKDVLVIRGRNHYPQEIEATVQAVHPALREGCGAAFETGPDGQMRLVVVQEVDRRRGRGVDVARLLGDVRQAVAERHELQVHDVQFLEPGSLPKTSSGKVQRHACRAGYERGTLRRWRGT
jgi:acyl-CoA synthetase (AMP-forming)/AMP-acid ligase II